MNLFRSIWFRLCSSCRRSTSKTVRYAFPFAAIALLTLFGVAAVEQSQDSYIVLEASPKNVKEGDTFFITVSVNAHTPINAIDIVIDYPEDQLEVTGIDTGESVITLWTEEPYEKNGFVYLRGGTFQKGFLGEHVVARIKAEAIQSGTAYVSKNSATLIAGDGSGTEVPVTKNQGERTQVTIADEEGGVLIGEATVRIITDIDGDGAVTLEDISRFMSAWFNRTTIFDFNGDGRMTFRDFSIILAESFLK